MRRATASARERWIDLAGAGPFRSRLLALPSRRCPASFRSTRGGTGGRDERHVGRDRTPIAPMPTMPPNPPIAASATLPGAAAVHAPTVRARRSRDLGGLPQRTTVVTRGTRRPRQMARLGSRAPRAIAGDERLPHQRRDRGGRAHEFVTSSRHRRRCTYALVGRSPRTSRRTLLGDRHHGDSRDWDARRRGRSRRSHRPGPPARCGCGRGVRSDGARLPRRPDKSDARKPAIATTASTGFAGRSGDSVLYIGAAASRPGRGRCPRPDRCRGSGSTHTSRASERALRDPGSRRGPLRSRGRRRSPRVRRGSAETRSS